VAILRPKDLDEAQRIFLQHYARSRLLPVLTPLAIDPGHPFPHLANRSLCLVASIRPTAPSLLPHASLAVVHIPGQVVPRFVALPSPSGRHAFMLLEDVIRLHLPLLYHGYEIVSCHALRVSRDAELRVKHERAEDLLTSIEAGLRERRGDRRCACSARPGCPPTCAPC
jgi:polyphosphate kinase